MNILHLKKIFIIKHQPRRHCKYGCVKNMVKYKFNGALIPDSGIINGKILYDTYEQALEAGLQTALNLIKNGKE